jgi:ubiquinone/menaquinone biosynthesis C-methylase UbiE
MNLTAATLQAAGSARVQGELWGVRAHDYAEIQEPTFRPLYESVSSRPELADAGALLDVGCGPGLAAQTLAKKIASVSGVDASAPFVEIARTRVPGGDFRIAEMEALPHADESFDVVTGFNSFQYAASPVNALREARRVAKPAGVVVIAVWGLPDSCDAAGHLKALGPLMPPPPPGVSPAGPFALSEETNLKSLAIDAGLRPLTVVDVQCPWIYPNLETALKGMLSAGPVERAIRTSGFERTREAIVGSIAPYRTASGGYQLNNTFRYLIARA